MARTGYFSVGLRRSKQRLLHGKQRGACTRRDTDLVVDVLHMMLDRVLGDGEVLGHVPVRQATRRCRRRRQR